MLLIDGEAARGAGVGGQWPLGPGPEGRWGAASRSQAGDGFLRNLPYKRQPQRVLEVAQAQGTAPAPPIRKGHDKGPLSPPRRPGPAPPPRVHAGKGCEQPGPAIVTHCHQPSGRATTGGSP